MDYRSLGNTGLKVSAIGLGGNTLGPPRLDRDASLRTVHHALDIGINLIDTAHLYNDGASESYLGDALQARRAQVVLATKFHLLDLGDGESVAARINKHCDTSLKRLRTDYLDLLQLHFAAPEIPAEVILEPLAALVSAGKVRYLGACNHAAWRHREMLAVTQTRGWPDLACTQNHYNLLHRPVEQELLPFCRAYGVGFLPYFPLAGGFLTGKYRPGAPPPAGTRGEAGSVIIRRARVPQNEALVNALEVWGAPRDRSVHQIAITWLLANPAVSSVIAGAMSPQQVQSNADAARRPLGADEYNEINLLLAAHGSTAGTVEPGLGGFR